MGYLDNTSVVVDAILTLKGRQLLAQGGNAFNITKFALGDDEVDYTLWNPDHPLGSNYYGIIIENMPITEAIPDETQALKYKLLTLPKNSTFVPIVTAGPTSRTIESNEPFDIAPKTLNYPGANASTGYTLILSDNTVAQVQVTKNVAGTAPSSTSVATNSSSTSVSVVGLEFKVIGLFQAQQDKQATITIIANETGGSVVIDLTVKKATIGTQAYVGFTS
jgi:hypothetical protein